MEMNSEAEEEVVEEGSDMHMKEEKPQSLCC